MRHIIIPSAKYAPKELNQLYNIPMALYPINDETILDMIMRQYNSNDRFYISCFEGYEQIKKYVRKIKNCKPIRIDELKDVGFSILNTMSKMDLNEGDLVVINFADTVIDNNDLSNNCVVFETTDEINKKWTYIRDDKGSIVDFIDKSSEKTNPKDYKLVCGVVSLSEPLLFRKIMESNLTEAGCDFYKSLMEYSSQVPFDFIKAQNWLDLGHPEEYFNSKIAIKNRSFNHMSFDKNRGILRKTSEDKNKFCGEIEWYIRLPKKLQYVTPRIFDYSLDYSDMFVEMEFYSYPTLLELYLYGNLDEQSWKNVLNRIKFVLNDFGKYKYKNQDIGQSLYDMYYTKTIKRLDALKASGAFDTFFNNPITINGVKYKSLNDVSQILDKVVKENLINISEFNIVHGDMCFANILIDDKLNFIKLIDPRGSFGLFDIYGDQRYELAKLFHSVDGKYDFIIKDLFALNVNGNCLDYSFEEVNIDLYELMKESFRDLIGNRLKEIEIIEALLFISMIPLHVESINHQYMMLAVGLEILDRWVNIKE